MTENGYLQSLPVVIAHGTPAAVERARELLADSGAESVEVHSADATPVV
jgi:hypothetical protein